MLLEVSSRASLNITPALLRLLTDIGRESRMPSATYLATSPNGKPRVLVISPAIRCWSSSDAFYVIVSCTYQPWLFMVLSNLFQNQIASEESAYSTVGNPDSKVIL